MTTTRKAVTCGEPAPRLRGLLAMIFDAAQHGRSPGQPPATRAPIRPWLGRSDASRQRCRRGLVELEQRGLIKRLLDERSGRAIGVELLPAGLEIAQAVQRGHQDAGPGQDERAQGRSCPKCGCPLSGQIGIARRFGSQMVSRRRCWWCGQTFSFKKNRSLTVEM